MKNDRTDTTSYWKLISFLLAGILIPLIAASTPWLLEHFLSNDSLTYTYNGPIKTKKSIALSITVVNQGSKTQENIEVWIPLQIMSAVNTNINKDGRIEIVEKKPDVFLETSLPFKLSEQRKNKYFIEFESLRPNESVDITIFVSADTIFLYESELKKMRIVSRSSIAVSEQKDQMSFELYRAGSLVLVFLIIIGFIWGIYYEYFMPFEKKEKYLLKQIDELTKKH
jgi:hypothetical protein